MSVTLPGFSRRYGRIAAVTAALTLGAATRAVARDMTFISASVTCNTLEPPNLTLCLSVNYGVTCDFEGCDPPNPQLRVQLLDAANNPIGAPHVINDFTAPPCPPGTTVNRECEFTLNCAAPYPCKYRIDRYFGSVYEVDCTNIDVQWVNGSPMNLPIPDISCPRSSNDMLCPICTGPVPTIANTQIKVYKTARDSASSSYSIYTLKQNDQTGATCGEAINGEFEAPADGLLNIKAEATNASVDVWGSAVADAPGWQTPLSRQGVAIASPHCVKLQENQRFRFNVVAGRSDDDCRLTITMDWYVWNASSCCFKREYKVFEFQVRPLPCLRDNLDPPLPRRRNGTKSDGSNEIEARIRCCGSCTATKCEHGNLTDWFMMWPTSDGQVITQGHAMGWRVSGNSIWSPGPDSREFKFQSR